MTPKIIEPIAWYNHFNISHYSYPIYGKPVIAKQNKQQRILCLIIPQFLQFPFHSNVKQLFEQEHQQSQCSLTVRHVGLHTHNRRTQTAAHENSFANPFSDFPKNAKETNPWNPKRDFLIEIHMEKGFRFVEINFWISRFIGKSEIRIWKSKSGFLNRTHPI